MKLRWLYASLINLLISKALLCQINVTEQEILQEKNGGSEKGVIRKGVIQGTMIIINPPPPYTHTPPHPSYISCSPSIVGIDILDIFPASTGYSYLYSKLSYMIQLCFQIFTGYNIMYSAAGKHVQYMLNSEWLNI